MKIQSNRKYADHSFPTEVPTPHEVTSGAVIGICLGTSFVVLTLVTVSWMLYRKRSSRKYDTEKQFVLRRPTALKSPNGANIPKPTLRKSPSPPIKTYESSELAQNKVTGESKQISLSYVETNEREGQKDSSCNILITEKQDCEKEVGEEKAQKLGQLQFQLKYDATKQSLLVTIMGCNDLPSRTTCDPYVKLQLLPEKQHRVKTRVMRKTTQPVYDEDFTFYGIDTNQLHSTTLHFVVLSFDRYSRDDIIGEVVEPLTNLEPDQLQEKLTILKDITPRNLKVRQQGHGEILVSLCHQPAASRLTVVILKARNLPKLDLSGICDPYVKIYMLYKGQRIAKKKTHVKKKTTNPVYNESFMFEVPYNEGLENISLEMVVLDWDRVTKNEVIGRLNVGSAATGGALRHWKEVCTSPRRQIAEWHKLKD